MYLNPRKCEAYIFVLSGEDNLDNFVFIKSQFISTTVLFAFVESCVLVNLAFLLILLYCSEYVPSAYNVVWKYFT